MIGGIGLLLVRRIYYLKRINDPVHVGRPLSFVSGADDVKDFVATVETV
jgi:hypothetical protein